MSAATVVALAIIYGQTYVVKRLVEVSTTYGYLFILLNLWKELCGRVTITAALCSGDPTFRSLFGDWLS